VDADNVEFLVLQNLKIKRRQRGVIVTGADYGNALRPATYRTRSLLGANSIGLHAFEKGGSRENSRVLQKAAAAGGELIAPHNAPFLSEASYHHG
jgi:hypothetical protein